MIVFSMNAIQEILMQGVAQCWHTGIPVIVWLVKSRQQGSSTVWQLLFVAMCELIPGFRVSVVAHDENGSRAVFSRAFTCIRQIRKRGDWPAPALIAEQGGLLLWESESQMEVGTIKTGAGLGLGGTPSAVHYSEASRFSDKGINAKVATNALNNAVPNSRWKIIVYESTASGKDPFFWPGCENARDPNSGSTARTIFLPWMLTDEYQLPWSQYRKEIMASGKPDPGKTFRATDEEEALRTKLANVRVKPGEETYRYRYDLSDSQLTWRRWAIINQCSSDMDEFKRYYPSFYEEAFTASAACAFDAATIDWYRSMVKPPIAIGTIHAGSSGPMFERRLDGPLEIWEFPVQGEVYVLGGDPGGKKRRSDPYATYVMNKNTLEVVASYHGHFEWDLYAEAVQALGYFYNTALIVVENNHRPAIIQKIHEDRYPNIHYYFDRNQARAHEGNTPGFNTNKKTRKSLVDTVRMVFRKRQILMWDPRFWQEMDDFVWVPAANAVNPATEGTYRATGTNHDDRIMAIGMVLLQCPVNDVEFNPEDVPVKQSNALRMLTMFQEEDRLLKAGRFLNLGGSDA